MQRADAYLKARGLIGKRLAAWIDVEGNADRVLHGFGEQLKGVSVALIEVEIHDYYERTPSLPAALELLAEAGLEVVSRDWMNRGQFNIVAANPALNLRNSPACREYHASVAEWFRLSEEST